MMLSASLKTTYYNGNNSTQMDLLNISLPN